MMINQPPYHQKNNKKLKSWSNLLMIKKSSNRKLKKKQQEDTHIWLTLLDKIMIKVQLTNLVKFLIILGTTKTLWMYCLLGA